jgi:outer membrane lipoprotein SlyB
LRRGLIFLGAAVLAISACANETPEQKHEVGCVAGTLTGALVGGLIGSTIGAGTGNVLATTAGAGLGTAAGERLACG